ncbi:type IV pilus biogenesis protein PilP [Janthinobacterium agaricidamnosum]|uniref:Type IV pilus biogenesis protein PilP n=1 Tax=Janthinobacterium agaricidamnosum NBRC 102515 = DSM 9628 TaxID=1349767 RepID=W0V4Q9_9BURK|nr:type IV pilus biogenesis protein PilP [Janthinobacterium agaricidamnosum]CDG82338.1 conserved hypothetical protein [Janthinobacterium agaricidamnosum NBRC 102515 = DSM 9628]
MPNNLKIAMRAWLAGSATLVCMIAQAAGPVQPAASASAAAPAPAAAVSASANAQAQAVSDTLSKIEAETLVLKARERQLSVKASIGAREQEIATRQFERSLLVRAPLHGEPTLVAVEGMGRRLVATLEFDNGDKVEVRQGDQLEGGARVVAVEPGALVLQTPRKQRVRLNIVQRQPERGNLNNPNNLNNNVAAGALSLPLPPQGK